VRDRPFLVRLTAHDAQDNVATNFNSRVALRAVAPGGWTNQVILGDLVLPESGTEMYTLGYSFLPYANLTVTHVRHYSGTKASIWTDAGALLAEKTVSGPEGAWTETALDAPVVLSAGTVYRVGIYNGSQRFYYSQTGPDTFSHGTLGEGYVGLGDEFPTNSTGLLRHFGVDLRFLAPAPPLALSLWPSQTTPFVNGVWAGELTISQTATNVQLVAEAGQASDASTPFDVLFLTSDVTVTAGAAPAEVVANKNVTLDVQVMNRGPDTAQGIVLTNLLPEGLSLLAASASQGTWTQSGQTLRFEAGALTNGGRVHIVIRAQALFPTGIVSTAVTVTNLLQVTLASQDPALDNNLGAVSITLLADSDQDGIPDYWETAHNLNPVDPVDGQADADGDGLNNLREYLAGTDPRDAASVIRITSVEILDAQLRLSFPSVLDRFYELQTTTQLSPGPVTWTTLQSNIAGNGETMTLVDPWTGTQTLRYYRIVLSP
jgi:uncharacterized repeat protein (TIGR01451 family)